MGVGVVYYGGNEVQKQETNVETVGTKEKCKHVYMPAIWNRPFLSTGYIRKA